MKKIIKNLVYDTATAKNCGTKEYGRYGDFDYVSETLFQKKTGEFFLFGSGGANTKYAVETGINNWKGGERIIPLTFEAAKDWAEDNLSDEAYESIFGDIQEDETKVMLSIYVSRSCADTISRKAAEAGISKSQFLENLVMQPRT